MIFIPALIAVDTIDPDEARKAAQTVADSTEGESFRLYTIEGLYNADLERRKKDAPEDHEIQTHVGFRLEGFEPGGTLELFLPAVPDPEGLK